MWNYVQGGEQVPCTETGLQETISCQYLVLGNTLSGLMYKANLPSDFNMYKRVLIVDHGNQYMITQYRLWSIGLIYFLLIYLT